MALITTVNAITQSGLANASFTSASESDTFENNGRLFLACKNAGESSVTFTVATQITSFDSATYGPATKSNATVEVAAGRTGYLGPFESAAFNNADGLATITYSSTTSVSVAVCSFN